VVGAGFVEAWVRASRPNVDFQATITEIRPDGKETFVQSGWLRGDLRKLDRAKSEPLRPALSLRRRDISALPRNRYVKATIPLYYQGHAYRAGSRIRVIISAPGGDQPIWAFARIATKPKARVWIAHDRTRPSRLTLPVIPGDIPTGLPPCPSLRAQPCRTAPPVR
jgi:predicted acyl esterase